MAICILLLAAACGAVLTAAGLVLERPEFIWWILPMVTAIALVAAVLADYLDARLCALCERLLAWLRMG